ncbi:MAG: Glu/Leu/Phe/Val family dehydrogenase [Solirubrobacteraceae bacterium]
MSTAVATIAEVPRERRHEHWDLDHEALILRRGPRSGVSVMVAVHSTRLGPALGGCRMWRYRDADAAVGDVLRLSSAMTLKAAAAGLSLGGGKGVICLPPGPAPAGDHREEILHDFAEVVAELDGSFITAEDVGTTTQDMVAIRAVTPHVVGLPETTGGAGDPGMFTALGVRAAMRACAQQAFGSPELAQRTVAIIGVGSVGGALARLLAADGAELLLADIDASKRALEPGLAGARWTAPVDALEADVDIVAPCALGGMIDAHTATRLRARVVCGSANNQLDDDAVADLLAAQGVLYAPDFLVNSGGLIDVSLELEGYDRAQAQRRVGQLEDVVSDVLARAEKRGQTPLRAARELAAARLAAAV